MHDFEPDDLTHFIIDGNSVSIFYVEISQEQLTSFKAAYYTEANQAINVFVQEPRSYVVYKRSGETQGLIEFEMTVAGVYTFIFSNLDDHTKMSCTLALHLDDQFNDRVDYQFDENNELLT